jgi:hypothetical protein
MALPSTFSPNLKIELMSTGGNTGQWGAITNVNLGSVIEQALTYQSIVAVADSATPTNLISVQGQSVGDTARSLYIKLTGALTAARTVRTIAANHFYIVENATTGGFAVSFISQAVGSVGVSIPAGTTAMLYCDGTNVVSTVSYLPTANVNITGGSINGTPIGAVTPSSGVFTSGSASTWNITTGGTLNGVSITNATGAFSSASITTATISGGTINGTAIGGTTPAAGAFTSLASASGSINATIGATTVNSGAFSNLSSTGLYTNTVVDGSAPMAITSTTRVNNLNVARSGYADQATIADDTTTNATFYPTFVSGVSGQRSFYGSSTKYTFNPNTGALTVSGAFTSGTLTPTNPLGTAYGGTGTTKGFADPRVVAVPSATSITPNADTTDILTQANSVGAGTLTVNAPTGTPFSGQKLILRITTTNSQTFSFNAIYQGSTDLALPSAMTAGTANYLGFVYNAATSKWQLLAKIFGFA